MKASKPWLDDVQWVAVFGSQCYAAPVLGGLPKLHVDNMVGAGDPKSSICFCC